jgi:hypothetical protein
MMEGVRSLSELFNANARGLISQPAYEHAPAAS